MKFDTQGLRDPELGAKVLQVLQTRIGGNLPCEGFVAGQSVASAIDEILGLGEGVYNDVDVFLTESQWCEQTGDASSAVKVNRNAFASEQVQYATPDGLLSDDYSRTIALASRNVYSVRKSRMDGMTNRVLVDWSWAMSERFAEKRPEALISVFDTNNVQVTVDLATARLTATPAYEQFLATRELKLSQTFTPVQSLLRYLKKREELGVYGNDAAHLELVHQLVMANELSTEFREQRIADFRNGLRFMDIAFVDSYSRGGKSRAPRCEPTLRSSFQRVGTGVRSAPLVFGPKYKALYDRFEPLLSPHFKLTERSKGKLWLVSSTVPEVDASRVMPLLGNPQSEEPLTGARVVRRYWELKLPAGKRLARRRELYAELVASIRNEELQDLYAQAGRLAGDAHLEDFDSPSGMQELARLANAHEEFAFAAAALTPAQQIQLLRKLRKTFRTFDVPDAWGICRGRSSAQLRQWLSSDEELEAAVKQLVGTKEPLYEGRLPLPGQVGDITVHELFSSYLMQAEGSRMRHCVAGYTPHVASNRCRIVSFRTGQSATDCATAEWSISEAKSLPEFEHVAGHGVHPLQVTLAQLRSFANSAPSAAVAAVEARLREEVNAVLAADPEAGWNLLKPGQLEDRRKQLRAAPAPRKAAEIEW